MGVGFGWMYVRGDVRRRGWPVAGRLLVALGLAAATCGLTACGAVKGPSLTVTSSSSRASVCVTARGGIAVAHTLPGDQLTAGPVLVDHRAVWIETGHRLRVRSLGHGGCARTVFSISAPPGAPADTLGQYAVDSVAGGNGRVAFVVEAVACGTVSAPRKPCMPSNDYPPTYSVTLFAGRPGAIRPVESVVHPARHPCRWAPAAVSIANAGLIVEEHSAGACPSWGKRLVVRTFGDRLVRVLARGNQIGAPEVAAGDFAAFTRPATVVSGSDTLEVVRVSTGQTVLRVRRPFRQEMIGAFALDPSGAFALVTAKPRPNRCKGPGRWELNVGRIGHRDMRLVTARAVMRMPNTSVALAGGRVAYAQQATPCSAGKQVVVSRSGAHPASVPGVPAGGPLAFDGRMLATSHGNTVELSIAGR